MNNPPLLRGGLARCHARQLGSARGPLAPSQINPAKAAAILNDTPRAVGRVLGEAAATAAMAKLDAGGTGCSFDADTPVATLDGQRAIGALEVGDTVLAFNAATGMLEADPITHVWVNHDPAIDQLTLSGETLDATPEHPFFTSERGWVAAGELLVGEHVRRLDGSWGVVEQLTIEVRPVVMYNLTVARAHTFFVGDEGWLVHNACGPQTRPIGMDEAIERASNHVGPQGSVEITPGGNVQFRSTIRNSAGDIESSMGRLDVNPADGHVRRRGPHLNLEKHVNRVRVQNDHIPIDPATIRRGDYQ